MKRFSIVILLISVFVLAGCTNDIQPKVIEVEKVDMNVASSIQFDDETPDNYCKVEGKAFFLYEKPESVKYGELDNLNRPTYATAYITSALIEKEKAEKREPIKVNPTAWPTKNPKVQLNYKDGTSYRGYMWNRSHMIADSLGGEPVVEDLITGTRPQNVGTRHNDGGMAYAETKVRDHFKNNKSAVWYEVTNFYKDDELIPRRTLVNMKSDDGSIDERVIVYNTADGFEINYNDASINQI